MANFFYTVFVGIPLALMLYAVGLLLCLTIIGLPAGFVCFALAGRVITLPPPRRVIVRGG